MAALSQLISHRFRGFATRESTLDGLLAALNFGVQQIEFDIRVTRCGTPLVTHDETARDDDGTFLRISEVLARDLTEHGGDFAYMPTAEAVFEAIAAHPNQTANILIDVKDAGFEDMIYALCAARGLLDRAIWVSWLPEVLYALHEIDNAAVLCLSHWCQNPGPATYAIHRVYKAKLNHIPRPDRRMVHGERSGWLVEGPLRGDLRKIVSWVCVPAIQISADLVDDYHRDGTQVSAFSYLDLAAIEVAESRFGHDAFFSDAKAPFDDAKARLSP